MSAQEQSDLNHAAALVAAEPCSLPGNSGAGALDCEIDSDDCFDADDEAAFGLAVDATHHSLTGTGGGGSSLDEALQQLRDADGADVEKVDLDGQDIDDEGVARLADALLAHCCPPPAAAAPSGSSGATAAAGASAAVVNAGGSFCHVLELDLSTNGIGTRGGAKLAAALAGRAAVRKLYLTDNPLGDEGVELIAGALRSAQSGDGGASLTELDLADTELGDGAATALAGWLSGGGVGCALTSLDLSMNGVGGAGAAALAAALTESYAAADRGRLTRLNLSYNQDLGAAGRAALEAAAAASGGVLKELNLGKTS